MKIVAKSVKGHEFLYSARSAHKVSERSAEYICSELNRVQYNLKDGEVWFIHDIDQYDSAYDYATEQAFTTRKGGVFRRASGWLM